MYSLQPRRFILMKRFVIQQDTPSSPPHPIRTHVLLYSVLGNNKTQLILRQWLSHIFTSPPHIHQYLSLVHPCGLLFLNKFIHIIPLYMSAQYTERMMSAQYTERIMSTQYTYIQIEERRKGWVGRGGGWCRAVNYHIEIPRAYNSKSLMELPSHIIYLHPNHCRNS